MISRHPVTDPEVVELSRLIRERVHEVYPTVAESGKVWLPPCECIDVFVTSDIDEYLQHVEIDDVFRESIVALAEEADHDRNTAELIMSIRRHICSRLRVYVGLTVNMPFAEFFASIQVQARSH